LIETRSVILILKYLHLKIKREKIIVDQLQVVLVFNSKCMRETTQPYTHTLNQCFFFSKKYKKRVRINDFLKFSNSSHVKKLEYTGTCLVIVFKMTRVIFEFNGHILQ